MRPAGEVEYARSVIRSLQPRRSEIFILLTFSSPSAVKLIQAFQHELDAWGPAPWDTRNDVQCFLKKWAPTMVLFSRTDVWPELSYQLHCKNTPTLLFQPHSQIIVLARVVWPVHSLNGRSII